jgi:aminoacrylate hydrolase
MPHAAGLWYDEVGPAGGPPVVLSAGLGGSASYWAPNVDAFVAAGYRVILYDHRGTGRSERDLPADVTIDAMADDLWRLLNHLGGVNFALVGHALGGVIDLCLASRAPNLVRRVVAINALGEADPHFVLCLETRLALLELGVAEFLRAQPIFLYPARWSSANSERLRAEVRKQFDEFQGEANVEARIAVLRNLDIRDRLSRIDRPVLLIAADDDMLVPASCSERLAEGLPNARIARMTGGHACNVTDPDTFNRLVLQFLGS